MFEAVIGLEIHAQLKTQTKLFCACSNAFGDPPNTNVCPVCIGLPGALPVLNAKVVELAIMAGLATQCTIANESVFSRKNYFYPDLPKGYQISQFDRPICESGHVTIPSETGPKRIGITRIHIEEDAGKLLHQGAEAISGATHSHVDLNRSSVPLIEIVSEPDIRTAAEARTYAETLRQLLLHLGVCDCNMDEGSLRFDANISIRPKGDPKFGTRTEIKNMNSFRSLERAVISEISRQETVVKAGGVIVQETRHYDDFTQTTRSLRSKEDAHDYRYFPDPDLIPLRVSAARIEQIRSQLPELPTAKSDRFIALGLAEFEVGCLVDDPEMAAYFDACLAITSDVTPLAIAKWVVGDLNALLKSEGHRFANSPISATLLVDLTTLIHSGKISGKMAKELLPKMRETGKSPSALVAESGNAQINDPNIIRPIIEKLVAENPDVIAKVKGGNLRSADFLIGRVMQETKGQAKPDLVRQLLTEAIAAHLS